MPPRAKISAMSTQDPIDARPISIEIPEGFRKIFNEKVRVVMGGFVHGIPVPIEILRDAERMKALLETMKESDYTLVAVPKQMVSSR